MKKHLKKVTASMLALLIVMTTISALPFTASAAEAEESVGATSGKTGNCTWTLNDEGILTISGNGAMENYTYSSKVPWKNYEFSKVIFENGVTNIGNYAFYKCTNLTEITIPDSVTVLGRYTFGKCTNLINIDLPDSVTEIGDYAFSNCTSLTSFNIPDSVTTIGGAAFWCCTNLTSINIPDGVTLIDAQTFDGCTNLTSVILPDSVTKIRYEAFSDCPNLTSITIPDSVTNIESRAIYDCPNLTIYGKKGSAAENFARTNNIPFLELKNIIASGETGDCTWTLYDDGSLTISGNGKMYNGYDGYYNAAPWTNNVKYVVIDPGVTNVGYCAFSHCSQLSSVSIPDTVTEIDTNAFVHSYNLKCIAIPGSVTSIGDEAFYCCSRLESVELGNGVEHIGDSAFSDCENLKSITLPESVRSIGEGVFEYCSELESVELGNSVESIGAGAFASCKKLKSIIIPASVTFIGEDAFAYCTEDFVIKGESDSEAQRYAEANNIPFVALKTIIASGTTGDCTWTLDDEDTLTISGNGAMDNYRSEDLAPWKDYTFTEVIIENGVTNIGNYAFYGLDLYKDKNKILKKVIIPDSVKTIGIDAFFGRIGLINLEIPDSVTSIGEQAFFCCAGLTSLEIPNSVTSIGHSAFSYCSGLTSLEIPNSVTSIGYSAFSYCSGLTSLEIPDSVTSIGRSTFSYCSGLTSLEIPDSVTSIGVHAFSYCSGLTSLEIPNSVTEIQEYAFSDCSGLKRLEFLGNVTRLGQFAFRNCSSLTDLKISGSITSIENYAFVGCNFNSVSIPSTVPSIGEKAFGFNISYEKDNLVIIGVKGSAAQRYAEENGFEFVELKDEITIIESGTTSDCVWTVDENEVLTIKGNGSMANYEYINKAPWENNEFSKVVIEEGVTNIGNSAFRDCSGLKSIQISNTVKSIGNYAFLDCSGLISLEIPNSVTSIGALAFADCSGLTSLEIPNSVTSIGLEAFICCLGLTSLEIPNSVTSIGDSAFSQCISLESITIPDSVTSIGFDAFSQCINLKSITIPNSVTSIGDYAFFECENLKSITIPNSVTSIGNYAFFECKNLKSITIPNSVTSIGDFAFYGCVYLETIYIPDRLASIGYKAFENTKWFDNQSQGVVYAGSVACDYKVGTTTPEQSTITLKPGTVSITQGAFFGHNDITDIIIPNTVTKIGSYAFANCKLLKSVTIPSSVKSIGKKAFGYYLDNATINDFKNFDEMEFEIIIFPDNDNKGISILGTKNSAAEKYATENGLAFKESTDYNYQFEWGTDNWGFDNVKESVKDASIDEETVGKLAEIFHIEDIEEFKKKVIEISDDNWDYWIGSCFGMTVAEILVRQGLLSLSDFGVEKISNTLPEKKDKLITLISVLQELQNCGYYATARRSRALSSENTSPTTDEGSQNSGTTSIPQKDFIEKIEEELKTFENEEEAKKNHSVILIEYEFKNSNDTKKHHAVLGYGIQNCSYIYNGKTYDHKILIADPNYLTYQDGNEMFDDACIYYDSSNGHWICPYWNKNKGKCYYNGNDSDPGQIVLLIKYNSLTDPEFYPEVSKDYYIAGLTIINDIGNQTVGEGITDYQILDQPNDRKFYAFDNTKECSFSYKTPSDYSMMVDYENISYYANVEKGTSTLVKPESYINIKGSHANYSMTMMTDNSKDKSDWYSITVSGKDANNVTLTKTDDGYLLETDSSEDSLGNITITAKNNSGKITGEYKIQSKSAIIKKNENTIGVNVDTDGDGTYETNIYQIGDVNLDGVVDVNDVTSIQLYLAKLETLTDNQLAFADVNGNGAFDINDATQLQKNLAGLTG